ncbi:hypothetical protein PG985_011713 [Apiospora marii]|uniref:NACHT domain-containing protein n=1 Tax=Apiospora marii TaxID=335849 RepID=A0ABR1R0B1_9PEZI
MEALAAVSLAGNILQFVDSTKKLLSTTRQISDLGAKEETIELQTLTRDLQSWVKRVTPPDVKEGANLRDEEKSIRSLGAQCNELASQLLDVLAKLQVKRDGGLRHVESLYKALLTEWKKDEIATLQTRLDRIGNCIQRHLASYDSRKVSEQLFDLQTEDSRLQARRGNDIMILGMQIRQIFKDLGEKLENEGSRQKTTMALLSATSKCSRFAAEQTILEQLWFSTMNDRYDGIRDAHQKTMEWVFATGEQDSPATFDEWLKSDDLMYWISGKPGSGKSTLMKFLCDSPQTKEKLSVWTKSAGLVRASYFFWIAGKQKLQKSQEGLLRSLVYQVLTACPDGISRACPDTWRLFSSESGDIAHYKPKPTTTGGTLSLSVDALLTALGEACAAAIDAGFKVCFFIDGLDEYYGEPSEMVELTRVLRSLSGVKICLSSRDWNEFEQEFGKEGTRKLYMQDFNQKDIRAYVTDTFVNDEDYQDLEGRDTVGKALLDDIVVSSNGVFLWVFLVVRSFREGLLNGDRLVDLKKRLDALPRDLNKYFERIILVDVADFYHGQCAEMFSATLEGSEDIPLLTYWFMGEEPEYALKLETKPLAPQQVNKRFKEIKRRLKACCKGMLEVQYLAPMGEEASLPSSILFNWKVTFLHRTVRDFLLLGETQEILRRWHSASFNPHECICRAVLAQIKISSEEPRYWVEDSPVSQLYTLFDRHSKLLQAQGQDRHVDILRQSLRETLALRPVRFPLVIDASISDDSSTDNSGGEVEKKGQPKKRWDFYNRIEKIRARWENKNFGMIAE